MFGFEDDWEMSMSEFEQRAVPVPIKYKGAEFSLSFGATGLPLTDLNEVPFTTDPSEALEEWMNRAASMTNPLPKSIVEYGMNFSFFFRDQLERDDSPLVPAPSMVAQMPEAIREKLGIVPDYVDKRSGKKIWGWPAKLDYLATQVPGWSNFIIRAQKPQVGSAGATTAQETLGQVGGLRVRKIDPVTTAINAAYDTKAKLEKKRAAMSQRQRNETPEYKGLNKQISNLDKEIVKLKRERGDKIIPGGKPKKVKRTSKLGSSTSGGLGSGSSGGLSGGANDGGL